MAVILQMEQNCDWHVFLGVFVFVCVCVHIWVIRKYVHQGMYNLSVGETNIGEAIWFKGKGQHNSKESEEQPCLTRIETEDLSGKAVTVNIRKMCVLINLKMQNWKMMCLEIIVNKLKL